MRDQDSSRHVGSGGGDGGRRARGSGGIGGIRWIAVAIGLMSACGGTEPGITCEGGPCQCTNDSQCSGATPRCERNTGRCQGCVNDSHCSGATPRCDRNSGHCEACLPTADSCPSGQRCLLKASAYSCQPYCQQDSDCQGGACCNARCIDTSGDIANCGGCGLGCTVPINASAACTTGHCGLGACKTGFADCNQNIADGCEIHTAVDLQNCGGCASVCTAQAHQTPACTDGMCQPVCETSWGNCDGDPANGCEAATQSDPLNCGACNSPCGGMTPFCKMGVCSQEPPTSCKEILAGAPQSPSGVYTIAPDGLTGFAVYCDMVTDGGGWTVLSINGDLMTEGCQFRLKNDAPVCGDPMKPDPLTDWQLPGTRQDLIPFGEVLLFAYTDPAMFHAATKLALPMVRTVTDGIMDVMATAVMNAPISCNDMLTTRKVVNVDPFGFTLWGNDPQQGGCQNMQQSGLGLDASSGMGVVHPGWDDLQDGCGCGDSFLPADLGSQRGYFAVR